MYLIYNGKTIEEKDFQVGFNNRAFNYGDGVFESIIADPHQVYYLADHIERLCFGIISLGIILPEEINLNVIEGYIKNLIQLNQLKNQSRIKIIVWRKPGGLFSPSDNSAEFLISAVPNSATLQVKEKVLFYHDIKLSQSKISRFKTLSSLTYVMAGIAKNTLQVDDLILLDIENNISECIASNIFWIKKDIVYTPSLETGCKEGIIRKQILNYLKRNNIQYQEGKYSKEELLNADLIFNCNVAGIIPLQTVEDKRFAIDSALFSKIKTKSIYQYIQNGIS